MNKQMHNKQTQEEKSCMIESILDKPKHFPSWNAEWVSKQTHCFNNVLHFVSNINITL